MAGKSQIVVGRFVGWSLAFVPLCLFVIFVFSCAWTYPVFKLIIGANVYGIGAQGYSENGQPVWGGGRQGDKVLRPGYMYTVPDGWPDIAKQVPPILVAHLVASILLALQLALIAAVAFRPGEGKRHERMTNRWLLLCGGIVVTFAFALSAYEGGLWSQAGLQGIDMRPDVLGHFVIVVGLILGVFWYLFVAWAFCCGSRSMTSVHRDGRTRTKSDKSPFDKIMNK